MTDCIRSVLGIYRYFKLSIRFGTWREKVGSVHHCNQVYSMFGCQEVQRWPWGTCWYFKKKNQFGNLQNTMRQSAESTLPCWDWSLFLLLEDPESKRETDLLLIYCLRYLHPRSIQLWVWHTICTPILVTDHPSWAPPPTDKTSNNWGKQLLCCSPHRS